MTWTKSEIAELKRLLRNKKLFASEIAERLNKPAASIRWKMKDIGVSARERCKESGRFGKWNEKYAHIRKRAMTYFLKHSFQETAEKFGLTNRELKSLMSNGYKDPEMSHLRKDTRRRDVWSFDETMTLLRASGLQQRIWISKKLNRGGVHAVKEMVSRLNTKTRYINGLPKRLAEELIGHDVEGYKVKAGPTALGVDCRPIIVPWVVIDKEIKRSKEIPEHIRAAVKAMASFQKRIHGTRGVKDTVENIKYIIGSK